MVTQNDVVRALKSCSTINVLYVEDDKDTRDSSMAIFSDFFQQVDSAKDGVEGLALFKKDADYYDLIITDINMPHVNGIEMIKEIRAIRHNVSIIVVSARDESENFIDLIELRVEGFILKPLELGQFIHILTVVSENIVKKREFQQEIDMLIEYKEIADWIIQRELSTLR
jgi:YesN/AraC family two-component response regulator